MSEVTPPFSPEVDFKYKVAKGPRVPEWIVNEAILINDALGKGVVTTKEAQAGRGEQGAIFEDKEILELMRGLVAPCFYVEYPPENLEGRDRGEEMLKLFKSRFRNEKGKEKELADYLAESNCAVSIAMISLDDTTAGTIRYLNKKKIPVVAWTVIKDVEGYWTNKTNVPETILKVNQIREWAKENGLKLHALGFDVEKPLSLIASRRVKTSIVEMARMYLDYFKKGKERAKEADPQNQFNDFIRKLRDEDVKTEFYEYPRGLKFISGGGLSVPGKKRVIEMVYTSFVPSKLQRLVYRLFRSKKTIPAFGIISGRDDETPGRDMPRIGTAFKTGKDLLDVPKGALPRHLTQEDLDVLVEEWLNQEINVGKRTFRMRELYLFALNDARVARALIDSLDLAFEKRKEKVKK